MIGLAQEIAQTGVLCPPGPRGGARGPAPVSKTVSRPVAALLQATHEVPSIPRSGRGAKLLIDSSRGEFSKFFQNAP